MSGAGTPAPPLGAFGLTLDTSLAFPELGNEVGASVRLEIENAPATGTTGWSQEGMEWAYTHSDGLCIRVSPGLIRVQRSEHVDDCVVRLLVLGIGLAAQLHFEGLPVLHATTVRTARGDVAVVGQSGVGKSSLTGALLARGAMLVADDIAAIDGLSVRPGFGRIKLWPDTARWLGFEVDAHERVHPDHEKRSIEVPCVSNPLPLSRIVVLERAALGCETLPPSSALMALLANHRLPELVGSSPRWLKACQRLVEEVEVVRVGLPGPLDAVRRAAVMVEANPVG